uniref:Receptor-type tyrosine-protein phosphatase zeta n=1 Tax=Otolemur garnettii TaxID=30611 RepID=H0XEL7_OTOGA
GALSQKNWGKKYPTCNSPKQSPINIDEDLTQVNVNLKKLKFQGWDKTSLENTFIHNTGKTVEINLTNDYRVSGGVSEMLFKASKITFHWGKCNVSSDGSEHSLEGQKFPLEMQIYCFNADRFSSFEEAVKGKGKIRALSILFEVGIEENLDYKAIIDGVESVSRFGKQAALDPFTLRNLLPNSTDKYYTYNGSLTSPPCTDTVDWIVFKDTVSISESQLAVFCEVLTMQQSGYVMLMDYLQNNFREQQYKFSRQVFSSYTGKEEIHEAEVCSSEPENVQADPENYTSLLVTWERPRVVYDTMIEKFAVLYQQLEGEDQTKHEFLTDGYQDLGAILNNLLPNMSYVLQIVAICTNGLYGKYSDQLIVDMPTDDSELDFFPGLIGSEEIIKEEEEGKYLEEDTVVNPGRDSATNQIRKKEPHVSTTTHYNRVRTKYNEAKTNRSPTRGSEFSGKRRFPNTSLNFTSQPDSELPTKKYIFLTSQAVTELPSHTMEGTSASLNDGSKTILRSPQVNLSGTAQSLNAVSITEYQEVSTDISEEESLLTSFKLDTGADDASGSSPATSAVPFISENISQGYIFSSENTEAITYDVLIPDSTRNASEESPSSGSEESSKDPSVDGNVWFPVSTDTTTQPEVGSGRESFLQTNYTELHVDESEKTTEYFVPGPVVSQGPSVTDMEMPHYSTFAYFPTEVTPHAFTPSSGQHDLAPTVNMVQLQTTQPVYNGETSLQPSYSSEVFPLVTPLLLDNQTLNTTPAASSSDSALHATPVSPSVDVSVESILSSSDGAPLLPFSSASFSSELFRHLHTVSQNLPQVTSATESDKVSLHASLPVAGGDLLLEPSLAQYSDVVSHQTTPHAASETLEFGSESGVLYRTHMFSQGEAPSSDAMMHARSSGPEPSYGLSNNEGSQHIFTVSPSSAVPVHESVDISYQGSLFSSPSHVLMPKSSLVTPTASLLQLTHALSGDGEWSGASSDSEFLLPDTDGLPALNISSPVSVAEFTYSTSVFGDDNNPLSKSEITDGNETELQISSFNEMVYHSESTVMPNVSDNVTKLYASLQETSVSISSTKGMFPGSLAYTNTNVFDHEISQVSENNLSVQPTHIVSQAFGDTSLRPVLSANSEPASSDPASSEMLSPSTQLLFYETSASFNTEALLQPSFQASVVDTLLKTVLPAVPSDPVLVETPKVDKISSPVFHPMVSNSASNDNRLRSPSAPAFDMSPTSNMHSASHQGLTVSYTSEKYSEPVLLKSKSSQQVLPSLYSNDALYHTANLEINPAYPSKGGRAFATPTLSLDEPLNTLINQVVDSDEIFTSTKSSLTDEVFAGIPPVVSDTFVAADHSVPLGNGYVSMTAVSPNRDVTTTKLVFTSKATSKLTHSARFDADLLGDGDTDDDDDDGGDDRDSDGLSINKCMSCSSYRESQEKVTEDSEAQEDSRVDQNTPISYSLSENFEDENRDTGVTSDSQTGKDISPEKSPPTYGLSPKQSDEKEENDIQIGSALLPFTPDSKAWAVLTSDEESGSGQGTSDSLNDNETSTDFSFPDTNERDANGVLEAGDSEITPGSSRSPTPSVTSRHSEVFNVSETTEASNSSHESRIGLAEGLESEKKAVIPLVIVSALTFICLVVLVGILIYWRKCFQTAHFYLEDSTSPRVISTPPTPIFPISDDVGAIPIKHFPKHVADLHASNGFTEEFETLKEFYQEVQSCTVDLGITADSSNHPDNKHKNRYINIVAYDHSRVKLAQLAEKDGKLTDYINANYVDGYNRPKAYIAAQGPLKSTAEDFWRMIWEHNVEVIVMITNLVEKGRRKCDQYWPSDGSEEYGNFLVTQKSVQVLAYYTVRNFTLRNTKIKKGSQKGRPSGRVVTQYHYTQWPDMGVPEYSLPVLTFVRKAAHAKRHAVGPVVVHCSAGVGRTGTYIVLDSMLQQIQHEGTVNVFGFLKHIRSQRNYLVQTEEQYVFIHDTLVEAILSKETEVPDSHIHAYVNALLIPGPTGKTKLEKQFQLLNQSNIQQSDYSTALKQCNREKNRTSSIIPVERSRVGISSLSGEGTDYINASYIMGYYQSNEFIITQHPLLHTIKDFWRMIWDHNAQLVVMIPDGQNMAEDEFVYWPNKDEPINCESFKVTLMAEEHKCLSNEEKLIIQDFILEATQDDYVLEVRHFQCPKWPNPDSPISKTFELISIIKDEAANRDGPVIVHDEHGGVTAGTFCALTTLMHQLEKENSIDVYQVAKMINLMRPGVFADIEQYQFLYKVVLSLVSTRQEENPSTSLDSNGAALADGNIAESLESLV